jgi:ABC-type uncharacterized transport system ATPase subunit
MSSPTTAAGAAGAAAETAASALLRIDNLGKRFGGFVALDGISLSVKPGERLGLIGPNGSGKSTLVNCICGALQNEVGSVSFDGHGMNGLNAHQRTRRGLSRTFQLPRPFASLSLADNMRVPLIYTVAARGTTHGAAAIEARCLRQLLIDIFLAASVLLSANFPPWIFSRDAEPDAADLAPAISRLPRTPP